MRASAFIVDDRTYVIACTTSGRKSFYCTTSPGPGFELDARVTKFETSNVLMRPCEVCTGISTGGFEVGCDGLQLEQKVSFPL